MTWFTKKNAVKKELQGKSNRHKFSDTRFLEHKFFAMSSKTRLASLKVSTLPDKQKEERERERGSCKSCWCSFICKMT